MLKPDYPIRAGRLVLRPYAESDFDALYAMESLPEVARYLYWEPRSRDQARESLEQKIRGTTLISEGDAITLAVVPDEAGEVAGDVMLKWVSARHRQGEIGYVFHPRFKGKGYASQAAAVMLRLGFDDLGLHRIVGRLDARNDASAGVLERLGMRREAHFVQNEIVKGDWADEVVYAMTEDEWARRR